MKKRSKIIFVIFAVSFFLIEIFATATIGHNSKYSDNDYKNNQILAIDNTLGERTFIPEPLEVLLQTEALAELPPDNTTGSIVNPSEMVNLYSGDFSYSIPLLTVPGPNGGFPVSLNYSAGVGMEDQASWVGLGWNLNPGMITRDVRGLPDDCSGEKVERTMTMKPNCTFTLSMKPPAGSIEYFGFDININECQFEYNNYSGFHIKPNVGLQFSKNLLQSTFNQPDQVDQSDSEDDESNSNIFEDTPSSNTTTKLDEIFKISEKGDNSIASANNTEPILKWIKSELLTSGMALLTANSNFVPDISFPMVSKSALLSVKFGGEAIGIFANSTLNGSYVVQKLDPSNSNTISLSAYGYMYSEDRGKEKDAIMDFSKESEIALNKTSPSLPAPIYTNDVYYVTGDADNDVFRPYRSDVGILFNNGLSNTDISGDLGFDLGVSPGSGKIGVVGGAMYSKSYTGMWENNSEDIDDDYSFKSKDGLFEPYFFKSIDENTSQLVDESYRFDGINPLKLKISRHFTDISFKPKVHNTKEDGSVAMLYNQQRIRENRVSSIEPITMNMLVVANSPSILDKQVNHIYAENVFPETSTGISYNYSSSGLGSKMIARIDKVNSDGYRYEYGIPVITSDKNEVLFSVGSELSNPIITTSYTDDNASIYNDLGEDHFYSKTLYPAYAQSYLLTVIYSPDYVDATGNGPSEDDLGSYTKFNYTKALSETYSRSPLVGAVYSKKYYSKDDDDKAQISYEKTAVWYVNSIETKTHIAKFYLDERCDGYTTSVLETPTVSDYNNNSNLKKLDKIELYSKSDLSTAIKVVHFKYNYELCKGFIMNQGGENCNNNDNDGGKLTLKKVWFTYGDNERGKLSPYTFEYCDEEYNNSAKNPNYSALYSDRWGVYNLDATPENPYTKQTDKNTLDEYAAAWCLTSIYLPSGSTIKVDYESDDYAYVQDKQAMQMFKITGTNEDDNKLNANSKIYFETEAPVTSEAELYEKYLVGIKDIYFKTYLKLTGSKYDYVEGYAKIDENDGYGIDDEGCFIRLKPIIIDDISFTSNPILKAGLDYLRMSRPDILYPTLSDDEGLNGMLNVLVSIASDISQRNVGYYNYCGIGGYCNRLEISTTQPSFIRLNNPDFYKLGGGHRVKKITYSNEWAGENITDPNLLLYGQTFEYTTADNKSSGVAEYEPLTGGSENALRQCRKYVWSKTYPFSLKSPVLYNEDPLNESYYPSPKVGYSRVVVKNIDRDDPSSQELNKITASGIDVYEFYTAKDFPVFSSNTGLTKKPYFQKTLLPLIGYTEFFSNGYSEGYVVELNDMPGKLKSFATYAHNVDINSAETKPAEKTEYYYNTLYNYSPHMSNKLTNTMRLADGDRIFRTGVFGQNIEFFTEMSQHSSFTEYLSLSTDIDFSAPVFLFPSLCFTNKITNFDFRTVTTNKIIHRNGILKEIKQYQDGALIATSKNLIYDSETGDPVLTSVTNNFDAPVYTYNTPSHWYYDRTNGASKNIGFFIANNSDYEISGGVLTLPIDKNVNDIFSLGDEILVDNEIYYVDEMDEQSRTVSFKDEEYGVPVDGMHTIQTVRSGNRNIQDLNIGSIVSLSNIDAIPSPVHFSLFDAFNEKLIESEELPNELLEIVDCATNKKFDPAISYEYDEQKNINTIIFAYEIKESCSTIVVLNPPIPPYELTSLFGLTFVKTGSLVEVYNDQKILVATGTITFDGTCFTNECMDGVLHADASTVKDNFDYNYTDVGNPMPFTSNIINSYRKGTMGIWNLDKTFLFQIKRKQTDHYTNISIDGTYNNFVLFNWITPLNSMDFWTNVNEITQYSPFGKANESKDVLGRYSSALYGYGNTLNTATGILAKYREIAFDAFEDYGAINPANLNHGHFDFDNSSGNCSITDLYSHTGTHSLAIGEQTLNFSQSPTNINEPSLTFSVFKPTESVKYLLSAWVKTDDLASGIPSVEVTINNSVISATPVGQKIDGWQKFELNFTAPTVASGYSIEFSLSSANGTCYFDDIRIQPFVSTLITSVYDPLKKRKVAELDGNNFATFYNYNEEGSLVQVKKETENGIVTISTTQSNIKKTQ